MDLRSASTAWEANPSKQHIPSEKMLEKTAELSYLMAHGPVLYGLQQPCHPHVHFFTATTSGTGRVTC